MPDSTSRPCRLSRRQLVFRRRARGCPANIGAWLTGRHYHDRAALYRDLADACNAEFKDAAAAGVTVFQLDDAGFTLHAPEDYPLVVDTIDRALDGVNAFRVFRICHLGSGVPIGVTPYAAFHELVAKELQVDAVEYAFAETGFPDDDFALWSRYPSDEGLGVGLTVDPLWYSQSVFYFTNPAAVHGPRQDVAIAPGSSAFDYELEVAALIGREGSDLTPDQAAGHIAGFLMFCDWSARDLQGAEMKLNLGPAKGKDSAHSLGPWLLTPDELTAGGRAYDVPLSASVNGAAYSRGNLADLYWSFGEMIAYASRGTRVVPGDLIGSGTVGTGCILELSRVHGADAYPYLRPGDQVRLDGGPLGAIEARVTAGRAAPLVRPDRTSEEGRR